MFHRGGSRARGLLRALLVGGALVGAPTLSLAEPGPGLQKQFGSDGKTVENVKAISSLLGPDSHFRAHVGLWYANLGPIPFGTSDAGFAAPGVNTGRGLLRDVGLGLKVRGNEAFFSYLDDRLLASADDTVDSAVKNNTARRVIKQLLAQIKPNLKDILGDHEVAFRVVYGTVQGSIPNADIFVGYNQRLYVPGFPDRTWNSKIFSGEVAVRLGGEAGTGSQSACATTDDCSYWGFLRYTNFSRPQTLSISPDSYEGGRSRNTLQDVTIGAYELGGRVAFTTGETVRFGFSTGLAAGYARVDFGRFGAYGGAILTTEAEAKIAYVVDFGRFAVAPYAAFRYLALLPFAQPKPATNRLSQPGGPGGHALVFSDLLGYSLWGPSAGLEVIL